MWLERFRFDGLRWDATAYIRNVRGDRQPWKISIAEDMQDNEWITRSTGAGGAGFDAQWDAGFHHRVRRALTCVDDADRDMSEIRAAIAHQYNGDPLHRVVHVESHDEVAALNGKVRLPEEIDRGHAASWYAKKRSTLGAALVLTSPGIPMIFQGQEFLEDGSWHDDDPLDWSKLDTHGGITALFRDLIALRRDRHGTTRGLRGRNLNVHHVNHGGKVVAHHRFDRGGPRDDVLVVANFANRGYAHYTIGAPRAGRWRVRVQQRLGRVRRDVRGAGLLRHGDAACRCRRHVVGDRPGYRPVQRGRLLS
ncbi:alpha amylase C-terminal domain-containing protein [Lentzea rhizosphaerae]|uniref:Alpha amylase C-terminal domain-containing protein n=1 Tax=Lentzea rhizosphaerae TaxID=2041025 RepID=A0ABV8C6N2_9PSEU